MSAPKCGVCQTADSKYKCPVCELRYCSIPCYKLHKEKHDEEKASVGAKNNGYQQLLPTDRPGTTQRAPKLDFTGFENDPELKRLLVRYPNIKHQLQLAYGVTLEPGPDDAYGWNRKDWLDEHRPTFHQQRGRGGRGGRGNTRGGGGGRQEHEFADWQRGPWTQEKGDKFGLHYIHQMRNDERNDELAEGLNEFIELCQLRFGKG
ncbi:unnamed protein product [Zymoseptoria tritici ST99CH_3D7]|uniref:HIT-type domain-containing protein n=2 Tax=Zymoseptoria tritici TaxID=1047171 RepID=A0A1X7RGW8_ZYMT9|nr:unnamed protein product [Zymoseptoria tritici ST99CH_3D7]SMR43022.1 unnamed protein product [Zymoseptoria tritici ST99CH_1E4]